MAEEMRLHLEQRTEENVAGGMPPDEARDAALRKFGGVEQAKERAREQRGFVWLEQLGQDLRYAGRQLARAPGFTTLVVLTLALGIGANTALFTVIDGVLLRPLPFPESERLVTLWASDPARGIEQEKISPATLADWQGRSHVFEAIAAWTPAADFNLITREGTQKIRGTYVTANLFPTLGVAPALGRGFTAEHDQPECEPVAVISDPLWRERFGSDPHVLGRQLVLDTFGRRAYTIIGVMPRGFEFPEDSAIWLPAGWSGLPREAARRGGHWLEVLGRLAPGVSWATAQTEMNTLQASLARENPAAGEGAAVATVPLLRQMVGGPTRVALIVLWAAVGGVLLIACANVASLLLARAAARQREIALRRALGAGRGRIARQLLTESLLLAGLAGGAGVLAAAWGVRLLVAISPAEIPRLGEVAIDGFALAFTAAATLGTGVLMGLAPAWHGARADVNAMLKSAGGAVSASGAAARLRVGLVTAEVALATVLLVIAGLMLQSFARLRAADRGFAEERVITAQLDYSVSGFGSWAEATRDRPQVTVRQILERLRELPGVQAAGAAHGFPVLRRDNLPPTNPVTIFGRPAGAAEALPAAFTTAISPGFLSALGLHVLRGRDFRESDTLEAPAVAIVNESFVRRYFPDEDPVGQSLASGRVALPHEALDRYGVPVWSTIVGVVSDMKSLTVQPEAAPEIYRPYWQWPMQSPILFVRTTGEPAPLAGAIRSLAREIVPALPAPEIRLMSERVGESVAQPRFQAQLLNFFGGAALLLAAIGIYGILAYTVAQRRREMGIRFALGAQRLDVLALVVGQGLRLTLLGIGVGITVALAVTRTLRSQLYAVPPADPATLVAVVGLLLAVALLAAWLPARRAARVDPMVALRAE